MCRASRGQADSLAASEQWQQAAAKYQEALGLLPEGRADDSRRIRLRRAKVQMFAQQLPEANVALRELVDQLEDDKTADPKLRDEAREALANAQYYMTWLMRLEGLSNDEWEPEIESSRQTYKLLAEQDRSPGRSGIRAKASRGPRERHPPGPVGPGRAARSRSAQAMLELQERPVQETRQEAVERQEARQGRREEGFTQSRSRAPARQFGIVIGSFPLLKGLHRHARSTPVARPLSWRLAAHRLRDGMGTGAGSRETLGNAPGRARRSATFPHRSSPTLRRPAASRDTRPGRGHETGAPPEDPAVDFRSTSVGDSQGLVHAPGRGPESSRNTNASAVQNVQTDASGGAASARRRDCGDYRRPPRLPDRSSRPTRPSDQRPPTAAEAKPNAFDLELKGFQYDVTLGDWPAVKVFLAKLPQEEGKAAYEQLILGLSNMPGMQGNMQMQHADADANAAADANEHGHALWNERAQHADAAAVHDGEECLREPGYLRLWPVSLPTGWMTSGLSGLGRILRLSLDSGNVVEDFVTRLRAALKLPPKEAPLTQRQAAKVLFAADCTVEAGEFLPPPEKAEADNDREALNLLARHYLALHALEKKAVYLERAWKVTQAVLAIGKVDRAQKDEAIRRAVELTPKIHEALGRAWLEESFTQRPERGMEIIAAIGADTTQGLQTHAFDAEFRLKALELQKLAVDALLRKAPERGKQWASTLALLADAWLREAEFSYHYDYSTSLGPRMQYDPYGNIYYSNYDPFTPEMMARQRGMPMALRVGDVVKNTPGDDWLQYVDEGIKPKFATVFAELYLKVSEEEKAFPYIERLSKTNPRKAKELAEEFVRVWTKSHDPNSQQLRRSRFFYVYGFDNRAEGIPLTRSKQERNLVELGAWVKRLRKLPIAEIDEKLLTKAFTACHSTAEVYRLDAIERVFGSFDTLKPMTLAELIQQMRGNLLGVWRQPAEQEKSKTKRREKDIRPRCSAATKWPRP